VNDAALQHAESMPAPMDEAELLAAARAGEAEAVERLVRRHLSDVYAVTWRVLRDRALAEDAAQDAMISALKNLNRVRGEASFRTWVIRIAVNAAHTVGRRRARRREVALDAVAESTSDQIDAAGLAVRNDEASRATALLDTLPEKQRMAVSLRIQQGLSYKEIGVALDCSEGAARVNYHLGVKRLRELMK
jgi:RNA polymerase sigma-70 factor (ECF subfamily)